MRKQDQEDSKDRREPSAIEWLVGAISSLLVLGGIGLLAHEAWTGTSLPPMVSIEPGRILPQPTRGYVVEIMVTNQGDTTAQGLTVEGRLFERGEQGAGTEIEKASTTLAWAPAHAEREGGLFFTHDPREYRLEITPQGYDKP